jgi:uncharacterized RDD family membrane protein YckC
MDCHQRPVMNTAAFLTNFVTALVVKVVVALGERMSLHTILFVALLSAGVAGFTVFYFATSLVRDVLNEADFWGESKE